MAQKRIGQNSGRMILIYFYLLLMLFLLLVAASYTWFSLSKTPSVSDLELYVNSAAGLELSADRTEWAQRLDFPTLVSEESAPLKPVTWSETKQIFLAAAYGADGRLLDSWRELSDARNANRKDSEGYYVRCVFYARTGQSVSVSLTPAVPMEDGTAGSGTFLIGTQEWNSQEVLHDNGGLGAEYAVRMGFRFTQVDAEGKPVGDTTPLLIYEPNCDGHLSGTAGYVATESVDGTVTLVPEERLIRQTTTTWQEAYPVQREVVLYDMGEFLTDTKLFTLEPDELLQIELYIWLEGQDMDCVGQVDQARILASIQFKADPANQSGMETIS